MHDTRYGNPELEEHTHHGNTLLVEMSEAWVRRLNSPLYVVVNTLTGVSISFAPLFLLMLGIHNQWNVLTISTAAACFLVIFAIPMFYILLAGQVIKQVMRKK